MIEKKPEKGVLLESGDGQGPKNRSSVSLGLRSFFLYEKKRTKSGPVNFLIRSALTFSIFIERNWGEKECFFQDMSNAAKSSFFHDRNRVFC